MKSAGLLRHSAVDGRSSQFVGHDRLTVSAAKRVFAMAGRMPVTGTEGMLDTASTPPLQTFFLLGVVVLPADVGRVPSI